MLQGAINLRFIAFVFLGVTPWRLEQKQPVSLHDVATQLPALLNTIMHSKLILSRVPEVRTFQNPISHIIVRETLSSILRLMIYCSLQPIPRSCYELGWSGVSPRGHTAAQKEVHR